MRDIHAERGGMWRNGFVEGERGGVTGTGNSAQEPRTQGTTPTGDVIGFTQQGNERVDQTGSAQTGCEHTGGDDDTQDVAVALTQAVKERLGEILRIGAGDEQAEDGAQDHGLSHAHLDLRNNRVTQDQNDDREQRNQSEDDVRANDFFLLVFNVHLDVVSGFAFIFEDNSHHKDTDNTDNPEHEAIRGV